MSPWLILLVPLAVAAPPIGIPVIVIWFIIEVIIDILL